MAVTSRSVRGYGKKMDCAQVNSLPVDLNDNTTSHCAHEGSKSGHKSKLGLLIRTPRRRRAHCENAQRSSSAGSVDLKRLSQSWDSGALVMGTTDNPGKSTWSGWRSLRKISDTLIDYALNEPYKVDSVFDDELRVADVTGVYRPRRCEQAAHEAAAAATAPAAPPASQLRKGHILQGSKTLGHAQGRTTVSPTLQDCNQRQ